MVLASVQRTWSDADLAAAVRDVLREEIIGVGHVARQGSVHVSDDAILAQVGHPSVFNRGTALGLDQPDVTMSRVERVFDGLPHTLWLDADEVDADTDRVLRSRGYLRLPDQHGVACTELPTSRAHREPEHHADLLADPSQAAAIADVIASGFGLGVDDRLLFEDLARAVLRHAKPWHHGAVYGVERDDRLVAVGSLLCTPEVAGLTAVSTLPMHRHQGHGRAIAARALHDASALGYTVGVAVTTEDSRALLADLGFRPVLRYGVYRRTAP